MHLPIRVVGRSSPVEVPFQLLSSFCFAVHVPGLGVQEFAADLSSQNALTARVLSVDGVANPYAFDAMARPKAQASAESILSAVLARLGLMEVDGERRAIHGSDALMWIGIAHGLEKEANAACRLALKELNPVWRDRTEPAPSVRCAADILDSYYQQVQDEVLGEWEAKAQREAADHLTGRTVGGNSEVAP